MRQRLADLKADQALGWEAIGIHDTEFLDLLVAMENARHPELALSLHAIDHKALRDGNPSAVADLAGALATSMRTGKHSWHAILSTNGYQAAVSVRHHAAHPERISLVVVSSGGKMLSKSKWHQVATLLAEGVDKALEQHRALGLENAPSRATVDVHCLHTGTQLTSDGETIFALSAAKAMPTDQDVETLHQRALTDAGERKSPVGVRIEKDNDYLGPRFFKYMTYTAGTDKLLKKRPAFETQPVNKKTELPLREFQAMHMRPRVPRFGLREQRNTAHENKRLQLYERAIAHLGASVRIDAMAGYLNELQRAHQSGTEPPRRAMPSSLTCWPARRTCWTRSCACPPTGSTPRSWARATPAQSRAWRPSWRKGCAAATTGARHSISAGTMSRSMPAMMPNILRTCRLPC
ncbi:hypothetical protein ACFSUI_04870 [Ralstonia solanacearum]